MIRRIMLLLFASVVLRSRGGIFTDRSGDDPTPFSTAATVFDTWSVSFSRFVLLSGSGARCEGCEHTLH